MIVFTFNEGHNVPDFAKDAVAGYRWSFEIGWFNVGAYHQYQSAKDGQWYHGGRYYDASVTKHWALGRTHGYYDGPHDGFSLGLFHLSWSGEWCDRCYQGQ